MGFGTAAAILRRSTLCSARSFKSRVPATKSSAASVRYLTRSSAVAADTSRSNSNDSLPESADVVVIGGGAVGCSSLYHLAKEGLKVVLLEKDELTSGTTWHSAAMLWTARPTEIDCYSTRTTRELAIHLSEKYENGTWIENGGLWISSKKAMLDEFKAVAEYSGKSFQSENYFLSPDETKQLYPLMKTDDLYGSLYMPRSGRLNPTEYCESLAKSATEMGGKVYRKSPVERIESTTDDLGTKRVSGVVAGGQLIRTKNVVCAAGSWAHYLATDLDIATPQVSTEHGQVFTGTIEGIEGMPNVRDTAASVYITTVGKQLILGGFEQRTKFKEAPRNASFPLYDFDWDQYGDVLERAMNRVPAAKEAGIHSNVCGPEAFTSDMNPLLGESAKVRGFYHCHGFSSGGLMRSGGAGKLITQLIMEGKTAVPSHGWNPRRFDERVVTNPVWLTHRVMERFSTLYYGGVANLSARNFWKDPLHKTLLDKGCIYLETSGWEIPGWFTRSGIYALPEFPETVAATKDFVQLRLDNGEYFEKSEDTASNEIEICAEAKACMEGVAIINTSSMGKLILSGPDCKEAADWIFSNDVNSTPGVGVHTCVLNEHGGIESLVTVTKLDSTHLIYADNHSSGDSPYLIHVDPARTAYVTSTLSMTLQDKQFNCSLKDVTDQFCQLDLLGPQSSDLLSALCPSFDPTKSNQQLTIRGITVHVTGPSAYLKLCMDRGNAVEVYKAVWTEGEQLGIMNAGFKALESIRLAQGVGSWNGLGYLDLSPLESGLERLCKLNTDTPFLGRAALEQRKKTSLTRSIIELKINSNAEVKLLDSIYRNGKRVGTVCRLSRDYTAAGDVQIGYGLLTLPLGEEITESFIQAGSYSIVRLEKTTPVQLITSRSSF